jgi:hypothetical protein
MSEEIPLHVSKTVVLMKYEQMSVFFLKVQMISIFHIEKWGTSHYFHLQILILDVQTMSMAYVFRKYIFCFFYCY